MQHELFGPEGKAQGKELAIRKQGKQQLSKKQKEFNRLIKKLEKLRAEQEQISGRLDEGLKYYGTHLHPLEQRLVVLRTACVKIFFSFYKERTLFSSSNKKALGEIIERGLDDIFGLSVEEPDNEVKSIFEVINGVSYEQMKKDSFEEMKWEMEELFENMGLDINLDDINESMSEEEVARKMTEMQGEVNRQAEELDRKKQGRKKTKKQLEREEKEKKLEEARKKNIGAIYKQLVKTFHPDLEGDKELKLQKEELMKQLTVAYEKNDLHTLLKLEMEWLKKEEGNIDEFTDDKLGIYNEVLREQVWQSEMEIDALVSHPRYQPLQRFADSASELSMKTLKKETEHLKNIIIQLEEDKVNLMGSDALKYTKDLVRQYKERPIEPELDIDDLLREFLKMKK